MAHLWRGVIEEYRDRLPVSADTPVVTLGEGGTPLVAAQWLSERTGCEVWLKVEGDNPTGSFKDRGMTVAISKAAEGGDKAVVCASTGNTSASAAAYAVRAGLLPIVLVPAGRIARGKLAQAIVHGAKLVSIDGGFDDCLRIVRELGANFPVALVNSVNPIRVGNPASWTLAEAARDESGGRIDMVTDEQILAAQHELASREGVFVEPASAAGVAGLLAARASGELDGGLTITVTVTGHGLKDTETALQATTADTVVTAPDVDAVARVCGLA